MGSRKLIVGYNDLLTKYPEIAAELDEKKSNISASRVHSGSNKKLWFMCPKGHSYETRVVNRTVRKSGCPYCTKQKVLPNETSLAVVRPGIAKLLNTEKSGLTAYCLL